jgi:hypothetical protein
MKTFAWQVENGNSAGQIKMVNLSKEGQNNREYKVGSSSIERANKPGDSFRERPNKPGNSSKEEPNKPGNSSKEGPSKPGNYSKEGPSKPGNPSKEGPSKPGNSSKEGPTKPGNPSKEGPSKPGNPFKEGPSKPGNSLNDSRNKAGNPSYGNVTANRKKIVFESLKVIGIILLLLVLLTGPFVVLMFMTVFNFEPPPISIPILVGLAGLNSALNPLVYGWRIEVLMKEFKRLFVCKTEQ